MSMRRVLVTGADGFIGSHLAEALVRRGLKVRAFVMYNSFNSWGWLDRAPKDVRAALEVFPGDIRDPHGVRLAMRDCDTVMHLAALIAIPFSYHSPDTYIDTNVKGTLNVVQAARELGTEKVVHTSTSEVYGTARTVPISESHPLQGQSPYAASKIGADHLALSFHAAFGTPVSVIRPFNTFGPRQSARAVIPSIIIQLLAGAPRLRLGALHPTRDFSYVEDTVAGFIAVAESPRTVGEVVNTGSGHEIAIGDLAQMLCRLTGHEVPVEQDEQRLRPDKSEVERLLADTSKAQSLLGWRPALAGRAGLEEGLRRTIEWFSRPEHLECYKADRYNI
jgi:NAD dependent epimerase/dehydratase